jgi:hypothetical protein
MSVSLRVPEKREKPTAGIGRWAGSLLTLSVEDYLIGDQHRSRLTAGPIMMMLAIRMRRGLMSVFRVPGEIVPERCA